MRPRAQHEQSDRDHAGGLHRPQKEHVRLLGGATRRRDVVRLLEEDRVDLRELDELLDLDGAAALRPDELELLVAHRHEVSRRQRVAADDVARADLMLRLRRDSDAGPGLDAAAWW